MESKTISFKEFMQLFFAVSFFRDSKCFDRDELRIYLEKVFGNNISSSMITREIDQMINEDFLTEKDLFKYLIIINDKPKVLKEILEENPEYIENMYELVTNYLFYMFATDRRDYEINDKIKKLFTLSDVNEKSLKKELL